MASEAPAAPAADQAAPKKGKGALPGQAGGGIYQVLTVIQQQ